MDGVEAAQNLQGNVLITGLGWVGLIVCRAPVAHGAKISIIDIEPEVIRAVTLWFRQVSIRRRSSDRCSMSCLTRLHSELRNDVRTQFLDNLRRRALAIFEIENDVVHADFLKRLQQKP